MWTENVIFNLFPGENDLLKVCFRIDKRIFQIGLQCSKSARKLKRIFCFSRWLFVNK